MKEPLPVPPSVTLEVVSQSILFVTIKSFIKATIIHSTAQPVYSREHFSLTSLTKLSFSFHSQLSVNENVYRMFATICSTNKLRIFDVSLKARENETVPLCQCVNSNWFVIWFLPIGLRRILLNLQLLQSQQIPHFMYQKRKLVLEIK